MFFPPQGERERVGKMKREGGFRNGAGEKRNSIKVMRGEEK